MRDVYVDLQQEFGTVDAYVDLHHMGPCDQVEGEGDRFFDIPDAGWED